MVSRRGHARANSSPMAAGPYSPRRLSLRDIDPYHDLGSGGGRMGADSVSAPSMMDPRRHEQGWDWRKRTLLRSSSDVNPGSRRGNIGMLANQLRHLEAGGGGIDPRNQQSLQVLLNCTICLGLTAIGAALALIFSVARMADLWQRDYEGVRAMQWGLATAFLIELALRLYTWGPAYCSAGVNLCDTYVIVGGACLTYSTSWGSAVLFLRVVWVWQLSSARFQRGKSSVRLQQIEYDKDETPVAQLYQLIMRTMEGSCSVFSVAEKKELGGLLSLLAHRQIYVRASLETGGADYWKEYGQVDTPRHALNGPEEGRGQPGRSLSCLSPTPKAMLGVTERSAEPDRIICSAEDAAVEQVLTKVDQWEFDPFELDRVTQGHPLVTLSAYLFEVKYNFFSSFGLSKTHFTTFMVQVEVGYGSGYGSGAMNLYHNRRHAADVTQAVHYFMQVCNLGHLLQDVQAIALILGSLIHDFKHRGRSNAFLTKTESHLALVYNDISVLENYHLSEVFRLLREDSCNFLRDVPSETVQEIRRTMVSMVLATDLKMHFDVLGEFNSHLADVRGGVMVDAGKKKTYESAMKVCIKSADVSHAARTSSLHLRWTRDVIEEFFLQGDEERLLGLEISPLCDRSTTAIAASQKNFIGFIVKPLFKSWVTFLDCPAAERCSANLEANELMWITKEKRGDESLELGAVAPLQRSPPLAQQRHQNHEPPSRRPSLRQGDCGALSPGRGGYGDARFHGGHEADGREKAYNADTATQPPGCRAIKYQGFVDGAGWKNSEEAVDRTEKEGRLIAQYNTGPSGSEAQRDGAAIGEPGAAGPDHQPLRSASSQSSIPSTAVVEPPRRLSDVDDTTTGGRGRKVVHPASIT